MSGPFFFTVITPEREVAGGQCDFLVVPTTRGELGVLADHAALIARVVPGQIRVTRQGREEKIAVGSGILEVRDNTARLLVMET
jgi:F-type H+-transporting ATPase subunit epsilon